MPTVRVMSETLASQVAAGEVIERPASVIKELVENSIDAGAKRIEVEIQRGGVALMRVRDDGCGMNPENAARALERHATSKLRTSDDLNGIMTLGFRGEALPSIASVSRMSLVTREAEAIEGTEIRVSGGVMGEVRAVGCPVGTAIEIRDLFFNMPARKKFLKAESTESAHIDHQLRLHALSTPHLGWSFLKDGRSVFDLPSTRDRRVRIEAMIGHESGKRLIVVPESTREGVKVEGAVLPMEFARRGRKHQSIFLNGRPVEDAVISRAVRDAFAGNVSDGLHPAAWLWLEMDPRWVDVNVHPAKREVRFADPTRVRMAITVALSEALSPKKAPVLPPVLPPARPPEAEIPSETASPHLEVVDGRQVVVKPTSEPQPDPEPSVSVPPMPAPTWRAERQEELAIEAPDKAPQFRILGCLSRRFALLEGDEGLVLLEPRAARERIFYERLLERENEIASQALVVPVVIELDARDHDLLLLNLEQFSQAGFAIESFGGRSVMVSAVPSFLETREIEKTLFELIDLVFDREGTTRVKRLAFEGLAANLAEVAAKRDQWSESSLPGMLRDLFACHLPYCDPRGRPTLVQISFQELDRKFGRG